MKHKSLLLGAAVSSMVLTGCIDNNYDLSDVDTTSQFRVNDLVIPINLETVELKDIIKIEEGDRLEEVTINGNTYYAVMENGDFHSDGITINSFSAQHGTMESKNALFELSDASGVRRRAAAGQATVNYRLTEDVIEDITYTGNNVSGSLRALTDIYYNDIEFVITLSTTSIPAAPGWEAVLKNVELSMPKGLAVSAIEAGGKSCELSYYNPGSGMLSIPEVALIDNTTQIIVRSNGVNLSGYSADTFIPSEDPSEDTGMFSLVSQFNIEKGVKLELTGPADEIGGIMEIDCLVEYDLGQIQATSILGDIEYNLKGTGLYIDPINLENMPSFLDDPDTDLVINNPQIFLNMTNPIGAYGLSYRSSLDIIAKRQNQDNSFRSPEVIVPETTGDYNFLLAPQPGKVTDIPAGFSPIDNSRRLTYDRLGYIMAGDGLPSMLDIEIVDPKVPCQTVTSPFKLDNTIPGMEGSYMFLAPLSLKEGSTIVKSVDGWWTEDLADLNIEYLTITADATNGLPTGVVINLFAIDQEGRQISSGGSVKLDMNATDTPIEITVTGIPAGQTFNNLDGIKLYVTAGANDGQPLAPYQTVTLDNIRAKVTGNYTKEL